MTRHLRDVSREPQPKQPAPRDPFQSSFMAKVDRALWRMENMVKVLRAPKRG